MFRRSLCGLALVMLVVASPAFAAAIAPGASMFAIELGNGTGDLTLPEAGTGNLIIYDNTEWGARGEFWKMVGSDYAWTISGGASWFKETHEPGDNSLPGMVKSEYKQNSWHVRIGGDRVVNISERAAIYFGPGIEYWAGSAEFGDLFGGPSEESPDVTRISLDGRMGGLMTIGKSWGLTGHVGHKIGRASAEEAGAKTTWWPSSFEGSGGLVFTFGGSQ